MPSFWPAGLFFPFLFIRQHHGQIQPHQSPAERVAVAFQGLNQDKLLSLKCKEFCDLALLDLINSHLHGFLNQVLGSSRSTKVPTCVLPSAFVSLLTLFS